MRLYGIYGSSGFGREVMPIARIMLSQKCVGTEYRLVFVDDASKDHSANGCDVLTFDEFLNQDADERLVAISIGDSRVRERLWHKCADHGILSYSVIAPNCMVLDGVDLGDGAILCPFSMVTSNARIGRSFHGNIYSYVAHDCIIGDFVTFAPSVQCNGNVVVEDHAYVGTNAIIKQGRPGRPLVIGRGAVIGMGAVVTKDIPSGVTVVGNPARVLER